MRNNIVTKSNVLIEANHYLTLVEERILLYTLSKIQPDDEDFKIYKIRVTEFCEFMGLNMSNSYKALKRFSRKLVSRMIELKKSKELKNNEKKEAEEAECIAWVFKANYKDGNGYLELEINPALKPHLLNLNGNFTTYKLLNIMGLKSIYSLRFYELLKQYEKLGTRIISVADLRKKLGIDDDKYKFHANFKAKAIDVAMRELEAKTDIHFTYEEIKDGRKVDKIKFYICKNTKVIEQNKEKNMKKLSSKKIEAKRKKALEAETQNTNSIEQAKTTNTEQSTTNDTNVQKNIQSPCLDKLEAVKEMLKDLNLSKENLLAILKAAKGNLKLIDIQYKNANLAKKKNIVGFLISALQNNYENIETQAEKELNYEPRNWNYDKLAELEQKHLMKIGNEN